MYDDGPAVDFESLHRTSVAYRSGPSPATRHLDDGKHFERIEFFIFTRSPHRWHATQAQYKWDQPSYFILMRADTTTRRRRLVGSRTANTSYNRTTIIPAPKRPNKHTVLKRDTCFFGPRSCRRLCTLVRRHNGSYCRRRN